MPCVVRFREEQVTMYMVFQGVGMSRVHIQLDRLNGLNYLFIKHLWFGVPFQTASDDDQHLQHVYSYYHYHVLDSLWYLPTHSGC